MNTQQIDKLLENQPKFKGTFPCDVIPIITEPDYSIIVNTDNSSSPGSHWTVITFKGDNVYYFDSFGRNYDNKSFPEDYTLNLSKLFLGKRIKFQNKVLQGFHTNTCAEYCIFFVKQFHRNVPFSNICNDFTENLNLNDSKIMKLYK